MNKRNFTNSIDHLIKLNNMLAKKFGIFTLLHGLRDKDFFFDLSMTLSLHTNQKDKQ